MIERPNEPHDPMRPELDPEGRPLPPRNSVVTPPPSPGRGSGLFIAAIVVVLLIIAGIFYASGPSTRGGAGSRRPVAAVRQHDDRQHDQWRRQACTEGAGEPRPANPATKNPPANGQKPAIGAVGKQRDSKGPRMRGPFLLAIRRRACGAPVR